VCYVTVFNIVCSVATTIVREPVGSVGTTWGNNAYSDFSQGVHP